MNRTRVESDYLMPDGTKILIRPAQAEDLPGMEWGGGEFSHFRRLYRQHFHNTRTGSTRMWVAQSETGEIIGQVFLMLYSRQHELADGIDRAYLFHSDSSQTIATTVSAALCSSLLRAIFSAGGVSRLCA